MHVKITNTYIIFFYFAFNFSITLFCVFFCFRVRSFWFCLESSHELELSNMNGKATSQDPEDPIVRQPEPPIEVEGKNFLFCFIFPFPYFFCLFKKHCFTFISQVNHMRNCKIAYMQFTFRHIFQKLRNNMLLQVTLDLGIHFWRHLDFRIYHIFYGERLYSIENWNQLKWFPCPKLLY